MPTPIKLVSLDIDGTLYGPKGSAFDAKRIVEFQILAKKLRAKGITPVLCTGKPANYVEAFAEAYGLVGKNESHVCEHGAVIFVYDTWEKHYCTDISGVYAAKGRGDLQKVADAIAEETGNAKEDKVSSVSIMPKDIAATNGLYSKSLGVIRNLGYGAAEIKDASTEARHFFSLAISGKTDTEIREAFQKSGADFFISKSPYAVNITLFPLTKAFGLAYAAAKIHKCGLENIVAIADDESDVPVFGIAGLPIAVANADGETKRFVKEKNGMVTERKSLDGVMDVMNLLLECKTMKEFRIGSKKIAE